MGLFSDMLKKLQEQDEKAVFDEKMKMLERNDIGMDDLFGSVWDLQVEGQIGKRTLKLYKLVDSVEINMEGMVRTDVVNRED